MSELFVEYARHLDDLRRDSKIRAVDFCEGICDDRTYRRYISGSIIMSQEKMNQFVAKLGFTFQEFLNSFDRSNMDMSEDIFQIFVANQRHDWDKAKKLLQRLETRRFMSTRNQQAYDYNVIYYNFFTDKLTKAEAFEQFKALINYPAMLEKKFFTAIEMLTLLRIMNFERILNENKAQLFMEELLRQDSRQFVTRDERHELPSMYSMVSRVNGMEGNIEKSLYYANKGIELCIEEETMNSLHHLYYYKSYCHYLLGQQEEYEIATRKCLAAIIVLDDPGQLERSMALMEKDSGKSPWNLLHITSMDQLYFKKDLQKE